MASGDNQITANSIHSDVVQANNGLTTGFLAGTGKITDGSSNEIVSGAKSTFTTNTATNHLYAGGTPNFVSAMVTGTATATSFGTITATQYTPAETSAAATTAYTSQI